MSEINRREFVTFIGRGLALAAAASTIHGCASVRVNAPPPFVPLKPSTDDVLKLAAGFHYDILLRFGQPLNKAGDLFGFNNDYLAYLPLDPAQSF
jgi:secreted PhoX family phosphatase